MVVTSYVPRPRVAVVSEQSLIAESVRAALADAGYDAIVLRWPVAVASLSSQSVLPAQTPPMTPSAQAAQGPPAGAVLPRLDTAPDLALMLCDFGSAAQVEAARRLIARLEVPWVVLTGVPPGPAWGAVLESGAETVMPNSTTLEKLTAVIETMITGRHLFAPRKRRQLVREWHEHDERLRAARAGLKSLTPRETDVLYLLHTGVSVREIATRFEVSEATVRSQVKAVLRKFDVSSQLAAVAAFDLLEEAPREAPEPRNAQGA